MNAIDLVVSALETSREWAVGPARDMADKPLCQPTPNGGNHPTWVMAHLAVSEGGFLEIMTGEPSPAAKWKDTCGQGTEPTTDPDDYPSLEEAIELFSRLRDRTIEFVGKQTVDDLGKPPMHVPPQLAKFDTFQTLGNLLNVVTLHTAVHIGQLCDARRANGRKPSVA
ncbi:MAG: DinB family protein [Planctomycetota bacterium]